MSKLLETDRRNIWEFGQAQKAQHGPGMVVVRLEPWGNAPKEFAFAALNSPEIKGFPEFYQGMVCAFAASEGLFVWVFGGRENKGSFLEIMPDLKVTDIMEEFFTQMEERYPLGGPPKRKKRSKKE